MKNKIFITVLCLWLPFLACSSNVDGGNWKKIITVRQLKVTNNDIPNWKLAQDADSFALFTPANISDLIDGLCDVYTNRGMIEAAAFHMVGPIGPDGEQNMLTGHSLIVNFGSDSNANYMYNHNKTENPYDLIDIAGYSDSVAFAIAVQGGITLFAHFKQFYFELKFFGFSDQTYAITAAKLFLNFFKGKIE